MTSSYTQCTCRDCMDNCTTAQQGGWTLCGECLTAGCTPCPPAQGEWPGRRPEGDYDCQRTASAVHIHVGHNVPGYLPESDVLCLDSVEDALDALKWELQEQRDFYYEGCTAESPEQQEKGSDCCEWCSVALDCEADLTAIADRDAAYAFNRDKGLSYSYEPPEGASIRHWMIEVSDPREDCEIFADQEA